MARIVFTESADADSAAIFRYLNRRAAPRTVLKYQSLLTKLYDRLSDHPESGAPRPALGPTSRIGVVWPYVILYEYNKSADVVTVLRIIHGHRRISPEMLSE
jgi:toxin ParE1/3/4